MAAVIAQMAASTDPKLAAHGASLQGPRTRGSTTAVGLEAGPDLPLTDVTDVTEPAVRAPGCRYLVALDTKYAYDPRVGALPYRDFVPGEVLRREGPHGPELYLDRPVGELPPTTWITVVVGPPGEYPGFPGGVVYTWHPGRPLAHLRPGDAPEPMTAVKVHNG